MSAMEDACGQLLQHVSGALLCAVVDLDSGVVLSMEPGSGRAKTLGPVVAEAAVKLVRGAVVGGLVSALSARSHGVESRDSYLEEAQLTTADHAVFCCTLGNGRMIALLVTSREVSPGMGWAQLKALLPMFEAAVY